MNDVINFETTGTCCKLMKVEIENDIIKAIDFIGGCNGNLLGIKNLVIGMNINEVSKKLRGIPCGTKSTSCPDQLAICLEQYIQAHQNKTAVNL